MLEVMGRARNIELLVLDVDGVLTDGRLYFSAAGEAMKSFDTQDGHGLKLLARYGVASGIITGRRSEIVAQRARELALAYVRQGCQAKGEALQALAGEAGLSLDRIAYVGDDLPDLPAMRMAGLGIAVSNAHHFVRQNAHGLTTAPGGAGAVREICELLLEARGVLGEALDSYLRESP